MRHLLRWFFCEENKIFCTFEVPARILKRGKLNENFTTSSYRHIND